MTDSSYKMFFLKVIVSACLFFSICSETHRQYYITNSTSDPCISSHSCYTLDVLASDMSLFPPGANITIIFESEKYVGIKNLNFLFSYLSQIQWRPWSSNVVIEFDCGGGLSISFQNVTRVIIASMKFINCAHSVSVLTFFTQRSH